MDVDTKMEMGDSHGHGHGHGHWHGQLKTIITVHCQEISYVTTCN
jgi:hypothetical protein